MRETTPRIIWMVSLSFCLLCAGAFGYLVAGSAKHKAALFREDILPKLTYSAQLNSYQAEGYARLLLMIETDDAQKRQAYEAEILRFWQQIDAILGDYDTAMAHADAASRRCFPISSRNGIAIARLPVRSANSSPPTKRRAPAPLFTLRVVGFRS